MRQITPVIHAVRAFWANSQQRKTVMWVVVAVSLLILAFGVYTTVSAQRKYTDNSDKVKKNQANLAQFMQQFMIVENGQTTLDLSKSTQADQMMFVVFRQNEIKFKNARADAYNQRGSGLQIIGVGVFGLALAYVFMPERKREPEPGEAGEIPSDPAKL